MSEDLFGQASEAFDRFLPPEPMERYFHEEVIPALRDYAERRRGSRHCTVGLVTEMRLPFELLAQVDCFWPVGVAIRLSRKEGIVGVLDADDPYVAIVYAGNHQRAYAVTKMWGSKVDYAPLGGHELSHMALHGRVHDFAVKLDNWERKHPPVAGFGPHREFRLAA